MPSSWKGGLSAWLNYVQITQDGQYEMHMGSHSWDISLNFLPPPAPPMPIVPSLQTAWPTKHGSLCPYTSVSRFVLSLFFSFFFFNVDYFLILIYLFIFGCDPSSLLHWLFSSCGEQGLLSSCGAQDSCCNGFPCRACGQQAFPHMSSGVVLLRSRAQAQQLWCAGLAASRRVGSSQIRGWTHVSYIGKWVLYHRDAKEGPKYLFLK